MKFLLGFVALSCLGRSISAEINFNDHIQQRITDVLEAPEDLLSEKAASGHQLSLRQFRHFVAEFSRNYESDSELRSRYAAFKENMKSAAYYVSKEEGTAEYGMTEFMDYEANELSRYSRVCKQEPTLSQADSELFQQMIEAGNQVLYSPKQVKGSLPLQVDYRKKGLVSKVLNQGYCASAYAYAAVTALETANAVKTGLFERLSKQQIIDCDSYNSGCCGGYPHYTYFYLRKAGGIETDKTYNGRPFIQRCHFSPSQAKVQVKGIALFANTSVATNEKLMEQYVAEHGPVVVMLTPGALTVYKKGILKQSDTKCSKSSDGLSSSITLVGYGEENGIKYWIGKNSWGPRWGEKGYIRFERGTNMCSVGAYGVAPVP